MSKGKIATVLGLVAALATVAAQILSGQSPDFALLIAAGGALVAAFGKPLVG